MRSHRGACSCGGRTTSSREMEGRASVVSAAEPLAADAFCGVGVAKEAREAWSVERVGARRAMRGQAQGRKLARVGQHTLDHWQDLRRGGAACTR